MGPGAEVVLVDVEPMLLGTDYHAYSISFMLQGEGVPGRSILMKAMTSTAVNPYL